MITGCEAVTKYLFPTVRAMIARELIESHGFTQEEAADRMGLTQPAISQYKKELRGYRVEAIENNEQLSGMISEISGDLARGEIDPETATQRLCDICKEARNGDVLDELGIGANYVSCPY